MEIQSRIVSYWMDQADRYSEGIQKEIKGFKKEAWRSLLEENIPNRDNMQVLDIGTGPGFFAILLSGMGHRVTAIDCTDNMLKEAKANTEAAGFQVEFHNMDCHHLDFADQSFDMIICRNLTWILRDPQGAYAEWFRVLKPGGRLLIFDANWNLRLFDEKLQRMWDEDKKRADAMGIPDPHDGTDMEESDNIARDLFLSRHLRPNWDAPTLLECGFKKLVIEVDITEKVWDEGERVLYRSTPMFMIVAERP